MKKLLCAAVAVASAAMISGCAVMANGPVLAPIAVDLKGPCAVGENNVRCLKKGEAVAKGVLIIAWGDASIEAAAKDGNITKIHHVDTKTTNILGVYAEHVTIVYGE